MALPMAAHTIAQKWLSGLRPLVLTIAGLGLGLVPAQAMAREALPSITPLPAHMEAGEGRFIFSRSVKVYVPAGDAEAMSVAVYLAETLDRTRGLKPEIVEGQPSAGERAVVFARLQTFAPTDPESYHLDVTADRVTIAAPSRPGLFYGAVTLWQLLTQDEASGPAVIGAVSIDDAPRFKWRGLMVDSARHFQSPDEIKKIIDAMAAFKLNSFHWHLVDDQSWRIEIKRYPKLIEVASRRIPAGAAGRDPRTGESIWYGGYYTQDEIRDIVAYAAARNINIVPEIEMPGHATAPITAYPEFGTTGQVPETGMSDWGIYPNLYGVSDDTFTFLTHVLDEVMDLFPGAYIHVGGDEAIKPQWEHSPAVQAKIAEVGIKDAHELQSWFMTRIGTYIASKGRKMIGWDEILEGGVPPDAAIMSWRGTEGAVAAARLGHDTVLSPYPTLYFDNRQSLSADEPPGRGAVVSLRDVYNFNPAPDGIAPEDLSHILGYQGNVWTEHIRTHERFEAMAFPRIIAVAEGTWTPAQGRDWDSFTRRLPSTLGRLSRLDIGYNEVPFRPLISAEPAGNGKARVTISGPFGPGSLTYSVTGAEDREEDYYDGPFEVPVGVTIYASTTLEGRRFDSEREVTARTLLTRNSHELEQCNNALPLALEDDFPLDRPRAVLVTDIMKPCWKWRNVDVSRAYDLSANVGNLPYNFQLADAMSQVVFRTPSTPEGELEVRTGTCDGTPVLIIPLGKAAKNPGISTIKGRLPSQGGTMDLCFTFTQASPEPLWAIDELRLTPR